MTGRRRRWRKRPTRQIRPIRTPVVPRPTIRRYPDRHNRRRRDPLPDTTPGMELLVDVEVARAQWRRAMRWNEMPRSDNVEDRRTDGPRGLPMGRTGGIGIGTLIVLCLIGWALGINPLDLIEGHIGSLDAHQQTQHRARQTA